MKIVFVMALLAVPASAVIVGGTSGLGNNNASEAGLASHLVSASLPSFPYWDNLVRVSDASGVYLGTNASTLRGWVLSANHVTPTASIGVGGNVYTVVSSIQVGGSDLKLYEIGGGGDPALPLLPVIPLASVGGTPGETALMFGRGFTNATSEPYPWVIPGTSDANGMRWGTNTVEGVKSLNLAAGPPPNFQPYLYVDFDGPGDSGVTAFDAQASNGDSGGGLFVLRGGVWELAGIGHLVDDGPDFFEASPTGDGSINPAEHGDFTGYSDVFDKLGLIDAQTGALVPEPGVAGLLALSGFLCFRRRR
jgi:hypothetical protein